MFNTKETLWAQAYARFMSRNCNQNGQQKNDNMTRLERSGQISLKRRAKSGEIVISNTDKSTEITISSRESYSAQGIVHTQNDIKATWEDVEESKKVTLCH